MPRKLLGTMTLETLRQEVRFTRAALKADPDAADLLSLTDAWTDQVVSLRALDDEVLDSDADASAFFSVSNQRLDRTCTRFGNAKLVSVDMDRNATAFTRYFKLPPSVFVRQSLTDQVSAVEGWLTVTDDSVLETYRGDLTTWSSRARDALSMQSAQSQRFADQRSRREQLAAELTAARDSLHRTLAQRATERSLGRDWPEAFFRKESRASKGGEVEADDASGEE